MAEKIYKKNIADACENYMKIFGANKNLYRIMPSMIDGLKPGPRRFIYAMYQGPGRRDFIKMDKAVSDTTGDYHPHGGGSVADFGANMANGNNNNICLLDGQGNFGSYKDSEAGAGR